MKCQRFVYYSTISAKLSTQSLVPLLTPIEKQKVFFGCSFDNNSEKLCQKFLCHFHLFWYCAKGECWGEFTTTFVLKCLNNIYSNLNNYKCLRMKC